jgi:hypothetical protein
MKYLFILTIFFSTTGFSQKVSYKDLKNTSWKSSGEMDIVQSIQFVDSTHLLASWSMNISGRPSHTAVKYNYTFDTSFDVTAIHLYCLVDGNESEMHMHVKMNNKKDILEIQNWNAFPKPQEWNNETVNNTSFLKKVR